MQRLVYSPSMKAWVKTDFGVVDLSPYLTECTIERVVDDVSKLELVFRNPKVLQNGKPRFLFTQRLQSDGHIGPVFHPMDPVTVTLERIAGRPIQVFTGYCDTVPHVQLFPGLARITASCTLKRLLHTYWDPGLPFVAEFMKNYGWLLGDDGVVRRGASRSLDDPPSGTDANSVNVNDSSFGSLLYAVLNEVGGWDNQNIYIQPIPDNINEIVTKIFDEIVKDNDAVNKEAIKFVKDIIGSGPFGNVNIGGGGGGGTGTVTIVGDSITDQSRSQIEQAISGITIYAEGSKHFYWGGDGYGTSNPGGDSGLKILKDNQSTLGDIVVVALGTNDDPDKATFGKWIDKAMTHIGSTKKAVFVTVTNRNSHNEAIQEAKSKYSNISIADWKSSAELSPDGVHPTEHGRQVFANVIAEVVNSLRPSASNNENLPTGTKNFQGRPVAAWIVPILEWAQDNGWDGTITSGYRTPERNAQIPGASPTSNHLKTEYPGGAIDVGDFTSAAAREAGRKLNKVLENYPGSPKLVWGGPVINDWGHFSADGH